MRVLLPPAAVAVVSWALVGVVRHYSLRRGVLDTPNARSSHGRPTPRGAGAGFLTASLLGFLALTSADRLTSPVLGGLAAVLVVAVIGWLDDHYSVPVTPRAAVHLVAGLLLTPLVLDGERGLSVALVVGGCVLVTLAAINVVNFMDGIDGLIGVQALVFGAHLVAISTHEPTALNVGVTLLAGALGFLVWNWPPARIFLGDVGSGGLAVFGLMGGLIAWRQGPWPFVAVFLPLFAIFLDAAVTLVRRAVRAEPLATAHRSHLYQRLANDRGWGHASVTLLYGGIAAVGAAVALLAPPEARYAVFASYMAGVVLVGWALDRGAPFPQPQ